MLSNNIRPRALHVSRPVHATAIDAPVQTGRLPRHAPKGRRRRLAARRAATQPTPMSDLKKLARSLTVRERLELIGSLWDSITEEVGDALEMADAERDELELRIEAHRADRTPRTPSRGSPHVHGARDAANGSHPSRCPAADRNGRHFRADRIPPERRGVRQPIARGSISEQVSGGSSHGVRALFARAP